MGGRCCSARWPGVFTRERESFCGSGFSRDAFVCFRIQSKELSSSFGGRVTFSLRGQRESNQRERPPRFRVLRASCPQGTRAGYGVCRQSIHGLTPNWPASMPATLRAFLRPPAAAEGARVEQRAIVARTRYAAAAPRRKRRGVSCSMYSPASDRPERSRAVAKSKGAVGGCPSTSAFGLRSGRTAEVWRLCSSAEGDRKPLTLLAQQEASRLKSLLQRPGASRTGVRSCGCARMPGGKP
jgi:hypothetical protein